MKSLNNKNASGALRLLQQCLTDTSHSFLFGLLVFLQPLAAKYFLTLVRIELRLDREFSFGEC